MRKIKDRTDDLNAVLAGKSIERTTAYEGSSKPIGLRCLKCSREWTGRPVDYLRSKIQGGCRGCGKRGPIEEPLLLQVILGQKRIAMLSPYESTAFPIELECLECGFIWTGRPKDFLRKVPHGGCRKCAASRRRRPNEILKEENGVLTLDISTPTKPGTMLIDRVTWDRLILRGIGRVHPGGKNYPAAVIDGKPQFVHRMIMGLPEEQVDHENGIKWDNRDVNLRIATTVQQQMNRSFRKTNKSGVIGVHEKKPGVWEACLKVNRKTVHRSLHRTLEGAAEARRLAVLEHCGEFAPEHIRKTDALAD